MGSGPEAEGGGTQGEGSNELLNVIAFDGHVRAVVAETTAAVERLRSIHDASPTVTAALGRVATSAVLLAATLEKITKGEPVLTVRVAGNGPAGTLMATASPAGWMRALVDNPRAMAPSRADGKLDVRAVVGTEGTVEVMRDAGRGVPYQGVVPIVSGEIGEDIAHYLAESEQTPSAVALGVFVVPEPRVLHAGGYIVQTLPGLPDEEVARIEERIASLGQVTSRLREGLSPDDLVGSLFPEGCQVLDRRSVAFRCGCSREKVERALKLLGEPEMRGLIEDSADRPVELTCNFCRESYPVSIGDLNRLIEELAAGDEGEDPEPFAKA